MKAIRYWAILSGTLALLSAAAQADDATMTFESSDPKLKLELHVFSRPYTQARDEARDRIVTFTLINRTRPDIERSQQQRPRPGAEIENPRGRLPALEMLERGGDQRLAVGARDEDAWADVELDVPEGAAAGDVGHRLTRLAPLDHRPETLRDLTVGGR